MPPTSRTKRPNKPPTTNPPGRCVTRLSLRESILLASLSAACLAALFQILVRYEDGDAAPLLASVAFSGLAFALSYALIRWLGEEFMRVGFKGRDMGKGRAGGSVEIPETMGAVSAMVYLLVIIVFIPFPFYKDIVAATSGGGNRDFVVEVKHVETGRFLRRFPHSKLASYLSATLSLQSVVLLGVGDDLFDIRWRHKILIPAFASIPMLIVYFVDFGVTKVVIPTPLQPYFGELFDLGYLYYLYMAGISIFCPNSINILAGINGLEVSQSIVIALLILFNDLLYIRPQLLSTLSYLPTLFPSTTTTNPIPPKYPRPPLRLPPFRHTNPSTSPHLFSLYLLLPFLGVSLALLQHNKYPAKVFVGDTYCYFAGMVFAVVAIQAHFSKTLLLLLVPQIFNFLYSAPQILGVVPCPRHRLPFFEEGTGLMEASWVRWGGGGGGGDGGSNGRAVEVANGSADSTSTSTSVSTPQPQPQPLPKHRTLPPRKRKPPHRIVQSALRLLSRLHLLQIEESTVSTAASRTGNPMETTDNEKGDKKEMTACTNLTLLNLILVLLGPMHERNLAWTVTGLQVLCGVFGLWVRHRLAGLVFERDNL